MGDESREPSAAGGRADALKDFSAVQGKETTPAPPVTSPPVSGTSGVGTPDPLAAPGLRCPWCGEPMPPGSYTGERRSCPIKKCARLSRWRPLPIGWDAAGSSRRHADVEPATEQGSAISISDPEPWPEPIDGAALLEEMAATARRFVAMPKEAADTVALWTEHAHAHSAADVSPLLAITSAERRSGKSTLRRVVGSMVPRPLAAANISAPALYRAVEKWGPTLLMDEADTWLVAHRGETEATAALRGIANSGHTRDDFVIRCEGEKQEPRVFRVWAPKCVALIGDLPDTLADRSITIRLRRRKASEPVERFRVAQLAETMGPLRSRAWTWAQAHLEAIRAADPEIPPGLDDRAADNWRPLLAIADIAGGEWPERARRATVVLSAGRTEEETAGVQLLRDVRAIMDADSMESIGSSDLVSRLNQMEDRPWPTWRRGDPITREAVARLLKPFEVRPWKSHDFRGYRRLDLEDAWSRYLPTYTPPHPPAKPATPPQSQLVKGTGGETQPAPNPPQPVPGTGWGRPRDGLKNEPVPPLDIERDAGAGKTGGKGGGGGEDPAAPLLAAIKALAPDLPEGVPLLDAAKRAGVETGRALAMALRLEGDGKLRRVGSRGFAEGTLYVPGNGP